MSDSFRTIKVFMASPSDVIREREIALHHLPTTFRKERYNELCKANIEVNGWEDLPSQTGAPQEVINSELLKNSDIVIAIFKHKLGTPIRDKESNEVIAKSGTAQEILYAIEQNINYSRPLGMVYYYKYPPKWKYFNKNWKKLEAFKSQLKNKVLYRLYEDEEHLLNLLCRDICENITNHDILSD